MEPDDTAPKGGADEKPTGEQEEPKGLSVAEIAALQAEAAAAKTAKEQLAVLLADKAKRDAADAERARQAKIDGGEILEVLEAERAEKAALAAKVENLTGVVGTYTEREATRLAAIEAANTAAIEALPERYRLLVPDGLDPEAAQGVIARVREVAEEATGRPAGGRAAGSTGGERLSAIPAECKAEAEQHGMDPRFWFDKIWTPRMKRQARTLPAN